MYRLREENESFRKKFEELGVPVKPLTLPVVSLPSPPSNPSRESKIKTPKAEALPPPPPLDPAPQMNAAALFSNFPLLWPLHHQAAAAAAVGAFLPRPQPGVMSSPLGILPS